MSRLKAVRRQIDLMEEVRDRLQRESEDDYEMWAVALGPVVNKLSYELGVLEQGDAYVPQPHETAEWAAWYVPVNAAIAKAEEET